MFIHTPPELKRISVNSYVGIWAGSSHFSLRCLTTSCLCRNFQSYHSQPKYSAPSHRLSHSTNVLQNRHRSGRRGTAETSENSPQLFLYGATKAIEVSKPVKSSRQSHMTSQYIPPRQRCTGSHHWKQRIRPIACKECCAAQNTYRKKLKG